MYVPVQQVVFAAMYETNTGAAEANNTDKVLACALAKRMQMVQAGHQVNEVHRHSVHQARFWLRRKLGGDYGPVDVARQIEKRFKNVVFQHFNGSPPKPAAQDAAPKVVVPMLPQPQAPEAPPKPAPTPSPSPVEIGTMMADLNKGLEYLRHFGFNAARAAENLRHAQEVAAVARGAK